MFFFFFLNIVAYFYFCFIMFVEALHSLKVKHVKAETTEQNDDDWWMNVWPQSLRTILHSDRLCRNSEAVTPHDLHSQRPPPPTRLSCGRFARICRRTMKFLFNQTSTPLKHWNVPAGSRHCRWIQTEINKMKRHWPFLFSPEKFNLKMIYVVWL